MTDSLRPPFPCSECGAHDVFTHGELCPHNLKKPDAITREADYDDGLPVDQGPPDCDCQKCKPDRDPLLGGKFRADHLMEETANHERIREVCAAELA